MKRFDNYTGWGALLVGAGALLLLQSFGVLVFRQAYAWAAAFGIASAGLLVTLARGRTKTWVTGLAYFGAVAATVIALSETHAHIFDRLAGQTLAGGLGLGFLALYLADRRRWWATLTGGGFLSLAAATTLDELMWHAGELPAGVFFAGMGLTFGLLYYLVTGRERRMTWALYTGVGLAFIGFIVIASASALANALWAVGLIGAGLYLIWRSRRSQEGEREGSGAEAR